MRIEPPARGLGYEVAESAARWESNRRPAASVNSMLPTHKTRPDGAVKTRIGATALARRAKLHVALLI